jgi:uncharacterized membrane protein YiaA
MAFSVTPITVLGFLISYLALDGVSTCANQGNASFVMIVGKELYDTCVEHMLSENGYVISGIISCHFRFIFYNKCTRVNVLIMNGSFFFLMNEQVLR